MIDNKANTAPIFMVATSIFCIFISAVSAFFINNYDWGYGFLLMAIVSFTLSLGAMKRPSISAEITLAYLTRLAMCLSLIYQNDGDADGYAIYATQYAEMPLDEVFFYIPMGAYLYSWIISFLFRFLGTYYTPVRVTNMAISVCCIYVATDIVDAIYKNRNITKRAAIWMAIFPNLIRFSSYFANREPILMIFMLLYLKYTYLYYQNNYVKDLVLSIIFLIPAMILHTFMLAMMGLTVLIILKRTNRFGNKSAIVGKFMFTIGTILLFTYMIFNGIGTEKFSVAGGVELSIYGISSIGNMSASGRAAYLKGVNFSNPILTILFLPVRMLFFYTRPFYGCCGQ